MINLTFVPLYQFPPSETLLQCLNRNTDLAFGADPQLGLMNQVKYLVSGYFANKTLTREEIEFEINSYYFRFIDKHNIFEYGIVDKICGALFICGSASGRLHFIAS